MTLAQLITALTELRDSGVPGETDVLMDDGGCYSYCFSGDIKVSAETWYSEPEPGGTTTYWRSRSRASERQPKTVVRLET